ncbi:MAG: hypothetical protein HZA50_01735, partial [Planctomycetes bacterium]|nr:hypothetical protein [Planctomycetota bacterium]
MDKLEVHLGTLTKPLNLAPADQNAADDEECLMNIVPFFITHPQPAAEEQPTVR